ncbi:hypothetical protein E2562_033326 [Oryza meyeriana var. granulata]|uniref:Uncharacterized protein n=1 Tax=Oryza meyeriana var. granulata TaxID=110450 RepID=A0A6G1E4P3_9ORYZ|nr:hypothetical protein E2562_033326 [Oryza meyeriana var. granulata]
MAHATQLRRPTSLAVHRCTRARARWGRRWLPRRAAAYRPYAGWATSACACACADLSQTDRQTEVKRYRPV